MIKNSNYVVIQGWMINELKLSGNNLIIYAIIYGFTQEENQKFTGNRTYLQSFTNSTKRGVQKNLDSLTSQGLIIKEEIFINNVKFCSYHCAPEFTGGEQSSPENKVHQGGEQSSPNNSYHCAPEFTGGEQSSPENKVHQGGEQSSPNNKYINKTVLKEKKEKKEKTLLDEDFSVSESMLKWALEKFPNLDPKWVIEETDNFKDYYIGKQAEWADWNRVWQKWIRKSKDKVFLEPGKENPPSDSPGSPPNTDYVIGTQIEKFERNPDGTFNRKKYSAECLKWIKSNRRNAYDSLRHKFVTMLEPKLTEENVMMIGEDYEDYCLKFDEIQRQKEETRKNRK